MPGEHVSCVGCHEAPKDVGPIGPAHAANRVPGPLTPWYGPAYDVLIHYIRRVGIEDDVGLLTPGEYHANTCELELIPEP